MHIPTCQTQELEILTFEQALVPTQWDFDREKWLYIPDHYAEYRYLLGDPGRESPDLYRDQPLHRGAGGPGQYAEIGGTDRGGQRLRQLFDVQCLCPASHPTGGHGCPMQPGPPPGEYDGVSVCPLPGGGGFYPCGLGGLGHHHRKTPPISGTVSGTWSPSGRNTAPGGFARGSVPRRGILTTRCICEKRKRSGIFP